MRVSWRVVSRALLSGYTPGLVLVVLLFCTSAHGLEAPPADPASGLIQAPGYQLVQAHCGACHSLNLVTQNRGDEAHWLKLIRWMQAKHNLWDLGPAETEILAYLGEHYSAPDLAPRRAALVTQWRDAE